jgi:hypothetical protein
MDTLRALLKVTKVVNLTNRNGACILVSAVSDYNIGVYTVDGQFYSRMTLELCGYMTNKG